ncbi:MAG: type VI secretion system-associated FHA domain protein TagH [Nitrosomonas sp.]|nr:type VI secretion system-associated FHA domain protein TagH [Nitrosomonas sp.]
MRDSINSVDQVRKTTSSSADELLQAFLARAGITNQMNPIELTPELMELIGMLLRESTQGTLDLLAARANIRKEMRAEMTIIAAKDNNPLKFSPRVEVALNHLLNYKGEEQGFMPPLPSIRDAYDDLRSHQFGFLAGMRATLSDLLNRFSPDQLEKRLTQKNWVDSILPSSRKAKLWNLFAEQYEKISQEAQEDIDTVFSKAFLQAYEDQVARLDQIKKKNNSFAFLFTK